MRARTRARMRAHMWIYPFKQISQWKMLLHRILTQITLLARVVKIDWLLARVCFQWPVAISSRVVEESVVQRRWVAEKRRSKGGSRQQLSVCEPKLHQVCNALTEAEE